MGPHVRLAVYFGTGSSGMPPEIVLPSCVAGSVPLSALPAIQLCGVLAPPLLSDAVSNVQPCSSFISTIWFLEDTFSGICKDMPWEVL